MAQDISPVQKWHGLTEVTNLDHTKVLMNSKSFSTVPRHFAFTTPHFWHPQRSSITDLFFIQMAGVRNRLQMLTVSWACLFSESWKPLFTNFMWKWNFSFPLCTNNLATYTTYKKCFFARREWTARMQKLSCVPLWPRPKLAYGSSTNHLHMKY